MLTKFLAHVIHGRGSVLLWRPSDILCTSGCMDDVIFVHNVHACIAIRKARALKVTRQMAAQGAESAVYYCVVVDLLRPCSRLNVCYFRHYRMLRI